MPEMPALVSTHGVDGMLTLQRQRDDINQRASQVEHVLIAWGARGRKFESCRPDQYLHAVQVCSVPLFVPTLNFGVLDGYNLHAIPKQIFRCPFLRGMGNYLRCWSADTSVRPRRMGRIRCADRDAHDNHSRIDGVGLYRL